MLLRPAPHRKHVHQRLAEGALVPGKAHVSPEGWPGACMWRPQSCPGDQQKFHEQENQLQKTLICTPAKTSHEE